MPTVKQLASEMSQAFIHGGTRPNGNPFRILRDESPQWMTDVCRAAHRTGSGDWDCMMPDDWRYEFIEAACDALAENDDSDDARDSIEPDVYTHHLTMWLHSRADRFGYCDQHMEEYGVEDFPGTVRLLQGGQRMEREEVFGLVLDALRELADSDEDEADEDTDPRDVATMGGDPSL